MSCSRDGVLKKGPSEENEVGGHLVLDKGGEVEVRDYVRGPSQPTEFTVFPRARLESRWWWSRIGEGGEQGKGRGRHEIKTQTNPERC